MRLLFRLAEWHAFAKLRLHTDNTLEHLEKLTPDVGKLMRHFRHHFCSRFETVELPREFERRQRQKIVLTSNQMTISATGGKRAKKLNISTYKYHSLGDYARFIRMFGGSDSFSTQLVGNCIATCYSFCTHHLYS